MKQEAIRAGQDWSGRDVRIDTGYDVRVHCSTGEVDAEMINLSSEGFRLRSHDPLTAGVVVTLEAAGHDPVKALICWACGLDAGGVFADPVAL
jgi:hypothetical protein